MKGNGKPPIPKNKNRLKPSPSASAVTPSAVVNNSCSLYKPPHLSSSALDGDGDEGDHGSRAGEFECGVEERARALFSHPMSLNPTTTATGSTTRRRQRREHRQHQQHQAIPPWKPMAHSCAQCNTKTTAERFKRTCFGNHEFVCRRYRPSLLRRSRTDDCLACRNEDEQCARRTKELANAQKKLQSLEAVDPEGCAKSNSTIKKQRREVQRLEQENEDIKTRTRAAMEIRRQGFMLWKS